MALTPLITHLLIIAVGVGVGLWQYSRYFRILQTRHQEVFKSLGSPGLFGGGSAKKMKLQGFIFSQKPLSLNDPELDRLTHFLRGYLVVLLVSVGLSQAWLLWSYWP